MSSAGAPSGSQDDTPLGRLINRQIELTGPMPLPVYMALCLTHPDHGYYVNRDPLGARGDFITAPEISQLFGEMIGIWLSTLWQDMGSPRECEIVELGPGRGTLLADAGRVLALGGMAHAAEFTLVEASPRFRAEQEGRLGTHRVRWIADIGSIEDDGQPLIVIANEFFDALPIRQFVAQGGQWRERVVSLSEGTRCWGLGADPLPDDGTAEIADGSVREFGLAATSLMTELSRKIASRGGAILVIDYGYGTTQQGETLQALKEHKFADPLHAPGLVDLTAHVDFDALAGAAAKGGLTSMPLLAQSTFLLALGIETRRDSLSAANPGHAAEIGSGAKRLLDEAQMGTLFKVFCAASPELTPYPFVRSGAGRKP